MSKRRRSSSPVADKGIVPSGSTVQSQVVWFEDGNIILQAENTQFKVHRSVLAKHSPVFADLFQVPQPTNEPSVDGCPVVQFPDDAGDVNNMLCLLYGDIDTISSDGLLHLHVVESMVRLGRKYQIDHLLKEGLRCLQREFPRTLVAYDKLDPDYYTNFSVKLEGRYAREATALTILKLAHECGILSILPALYLHTIQFLMDHLLSHKEAPSLPFEAIRSIVCGRENILRMWTEYAPEAHTSDLPDEGCTSRARCRATTETLENLLSQPPPDINAVFLRWTDFMDSWSNLEELVDEDLCKACTSMVQMNHDKSARRIMWNRLPLFFRLPAWGELKDLEG